MIPGSKEWLILMREGVFARRPPVPWEPPPKLKNPADDPLVRAVLKAFPGATVVNVKVTSNEKVRTKSRKHSRKAVGPMANKFTAGRIVARMNGMPCAYCKRIMNSNSPDLMPTRDHIHPRSKGGREIIWACWTCNHIKADMTPQQWAGLMAANPKWWHGVAKERRRAARLSDILPYADSMYILRHGKKAWREMVAKREAVGAPPAVPVRYDDPKAQAAFEAVYKDRLHMLRTPAAE